jgi:hypothetical protein
MNMSNFGKCEYWLDLCDDDLKTAEWLLQGGRFVALRIFLSPSYRESI